MNRGCPTDRSPPIADVRHSDHGYRVRRRIWLLVPMGVVALLTAAGSVWLLGSAVVIDETGRVTRANIFDGFGNRRTLHKLWPGYFFAFPSAADSSIHIRCGNGMEYRRGYVSSHLHETIRVVGQDCTPAVPR